MGFRVGDVATVASLPTPSITWRGYLLRVQDSSAGDSLHWCRYNGAAYEWAQVVP